MRPNCFQPTIPKVFKYFKSLRRHDLPCTMRRGHLEATTNFVNSELLNDYFASFVSDNGTIVLPPCSRFISNNEFVITKLEVLIDFQFLFTTKSRGIDGLPPLVLKESANEIHSSVFNLFRKICRLYVCPSEWKTGIIKPIHKDGSKCKIPDYRPNTLLNLLSKAFEKLMYIYLFPIFLGTSCSHQFGFFSLVLVVHTSLDLCPDDLLYHNYYHVLVRLTTTISIFLNYAIF